MASLISCAFEKMEILIQKMLKNSFILVSILVIYIFDYFIHYPHAKFHLPVSTEVLSLF